MFRTIKARAVPGPSPAPISRDGSAYRAAVIVKQHKVVKSQNAKVRDAATQLKTLNF
jgi:hypothetical protein